MSNYAIYCPQGKAGEYSEWACNLYTGCSNGCAYCYLKKGINSGVLGGDEPVVKKTLGSDPNKAFQIFEKELKEHKDEIIASGGGLFFTFTSDPCLPKTIDLNMVCIKNAIELGVPCVLLTKRADWLDSDAFKWVRDSLGMEKVRQGLSVGFTLTGCDGMEPCASSNQERIEAMKTLAENGINTWASIEPVIDVAASYRMIQQTAGFCSRYKIGLLSGKRSYTRDDIRKFVQDVLAIVPQERIYWKTSLLKFVK